MNEITHHTITLNVACTEELAAELQGLFNAIATGVEEHETKRGLAQSLLPPGYVRVANGNLALAANVKDQDELEDAMVADLHALLAGVAAGITHFRDRVREDGQAFVETLATKYGRKPRAKTNDRQPQVSLVSLDGSRKIVYERDNRVEFGPDIVRATVRVSSPAPCG